MTATQKPGHCPLWLWCHDGLLFCAWSLGHELRQESGVAACLSEHCPHVSANREYFLGAYSGTGICLSFLLTTPEFPKEARGLPGKPTDISRPLRAPSNLYLVFLPSPHPECWGPCCHRGPCCPSKRRVQGHQASACVSSNYTV